MNEQGTVNSQIIDSVADVVTLNDGIAPSTAFGMLDTVMTETLGMAMYNAVSRQQGSSMIGSAATTAVCAKMLATPFVTEVIVTPPPAPAPPPPPPPSGVQPLPPVPPKPPPWSASATIAAAAKEGEWAIEVLKAEEKDSSKDAVTARASLERLAVEATPSVAAGIVAAAAAEAEQKIRYLQIQAHGPASTQQAEAKTSLETLAGDAGAAPPPPPVPPTDPVKAATDDAAAAIHTLQQEAAGTPEPADAAKARAELKKIVKEATFVAPPPPPPPPPPPLSAAAVRRPRRQG
jgi:hypothetical protein